VDVLGGWLRQYLPVAAVVALAATVLWGLLVLRRRDHGHPLRRTIREAGADVLLALSLVAILALTILPEAVPAVPASRRSLVPFEDLARSLGPGMPAYATDLAVGNLLANLLLFLPFGFALGLRFPAAPLWRSLSIMVVLSASVEVIQLVAGTGRSADITDVLTNTVGGLVGLLLARGTVALVRSFRAGG
jgi:glycopeptide antibiotics resistance protein